VIAWLAANALVLAIAQGSLPFDRPALAGSSFAQQVLFPNVGLLEVLMLIGVVYALTRKRAVPDLAAVLSSTATENCSSGLPLCV
jgi:hypothetical protein